MAAKKAPSGERLFANLLSNQRAEHRTLLEATVVPAKRGARYRCKVCRDTGRVKVKRDIGRTTTCTACVDEVSTAPPSANADRATQSVLYPKRFKPEQ